MQEVIKSYIFSYIPNFSYELHTAKCGSERALAHIKQMWKILWIEV